MQVGTALLFYGSSFLEKVVHFSVVIYIFVLASCGPPTHLANAWWLTKARKKNTCPLEARYTNTLFWWTEIAWPNTSKSLGFATPNAAQPLADPTFMLLYPAIVPQQEWTLAFSNHRRDALNRAREKMIVNQGGRPLLGAQQITDPFCPCRCFMVATEIPA